MRLKELRRANGITQTELAAVIGISQSAIAQWELNIAKPQADKLPLLAKVLGCTIDDLLMDETGGSENAIVQE